MDKTKKQKKPKHGKKNWRKNIDISEIELALQKQNQDELLKKQISHLKDEELFAVDTSTQHTNKDKLLGMKTQRKEKKQKKQSKNEQRQIKRIIESNTIHHNNEQLPKQEVYDLWSEDTNPSSKTKTSKIITYPTVPLPHPGQSYNPDKKDLTLLLNKVVDNNKHILNKPSETSKQINDHESNDEDEEEEEESSASFNNESSSNDDDDDDDNANPLPVSNNPKVDDANRKTRKEKRLKEQKKQNILKDKLARAKKQAKIDLFNSKSTKQVLKEQKKQNDILAKQTKEKQIQFHNHQHQLRHGIVEDNELIEDFAIGKEPLPLRKIRPSTSTLSERWENVIKRNIIGKYNPTEGKKRNRKLNKIHYMNIDGDHYDITEDKPLHIIE